MAEKINQGFDNSRKIPHAPKILPYSTGRLAWIETEPWDSARDRRGE